jgi:hypothetical protein
LQVLAYRDYLTGIIIPVKKSLQLIPVGVFATRREAEVGADGGHVMGEPLIDSSRRRNKISFVKCSSVLFSSRHLL